MHGRPAWATDPCLAQTDSGLRRSLRTTAVSRSLGRGVGRVADQQSTTNPPPPPPRPPARRCTGEYLPSRRCCCCGFIPSPLPVARRQHRKSVPLPSPSRAHRDVRSRYVHTHSATDRDEGAALQLRAREGPLSIHRPETTVPPPSRPLPGLQPPWRCGVAGPLMLAHLPWAELWRAQHGACSDRPVR